MGARATLIGAALVVLVGCTDDRDPLDIGEYTPTSAYLTDPDSAAAFAVDCADFWTAARDDVHGGYFSNVDEQGGPTEDTYKSTVALSRDGYGFARAFMLTGDEAYLEHAEHALRFLVEHGWEEEHGGWIFTTDEGGEPVALVEEWDPNTFKWVFVQHYTLVGLAAMCEATRDEQWCGWLDEGRRVLDEHMWDPVASGYFESADLDWSDPGAKGFTATVDAFTTHGLPLALGDEAAEHEPRALELADLMVQHFVAGLAESEIGFTESYSDTWEPISGAIWTQPGHVLKTAWSLARAYRLEPRDEYLEGAVALVRDTLDNGGYDEEFGGPYFEMFTNTGRCADDAKVHWVLEQGVVAGLALVPLVADPALRADLLRMADESAAFHIDHIVDETYGETYYEVSRDGLIIRDETKGDAFKAGYHNVELGYYTYLYASLYLHDEPVTLHYKFEAADEDRALRVQPLAALPGDLLITEVSIDGEPFVDFDATEFTLSVPGGVGGTFQVTYQPG